jgi:hypothetical protein
MMLTWKGTTMMMSFMSIKKKNEGHHSLSFIVSDGVGLTELATRDVELMEEELGPSKKRLRKSKRLAKKQESYE